MLVITSELYVDLILFPAPIQAGVYSCIPCAWILHTRKSSQQEFVRGDEVLRPQVWKDLLPSEDLPEICLIL